MEKQHSNVLDEFAKDLSGELLSDVAERFFGERVEIDHMRETLDRFIQTLQKAAQRPLEKLAVLDALLLHETGRQTFFNEIGIDRSVFTGMAQKPSAQFPAVPKAFTQKRRYVLLALQSYDAFQNACQVYQHGGVTADQNSADESVPMICVDLVQEMAVLLNEKIKRVNNRATSECTLQFVRSLDFQATEAEHFAGMIPGRYASGITQAMCYLPVDIAHLPIVSYPVPPRMDQVKGRLIQFWSRFYGENKKDVRRLMDGL
jgi:hypothetical protein